MAVREVLENMKGGASILYTKDIEGLIQFYLET